MTSITGQPYMRSPNQPEPGAGKMCDSCHHQQIDYGVASCAQPEETHDLERVSLGGRPTGDSDVLGREFIESCPGFKLDISATPLW